MHANVQTRFNPAIGEKAPYYRLKESYRDVRGNVHSLILLNVGFDPSIDALQAIYANHQTFWVEILCGLILPSYFEVVIGII